MDLDPKSLLAVDLNPYRLASCGSSFLPLKNVYFFVIIKNEILLKADNLIIPVR